MGMEGTEGGGEVEERPGSGLAALLLNLETISQYFATALDISRFPSEGMGMGGENSIVGLEDAVGGVVMESGLVEPRFPFEAAIQKSVAA